MDRPIELIPLVCMKCNTPVPAEPDEVAWVCTQCGQGLSLDEEKGLAPLEVCFSSRIKPNSIGKPFWVAEGRVSQQRKSYSGNQNREAEIFWSQPRRFCVPAYAGTLENLVSQGMQLLLQPPVLEPGPKARFEPVVLHPEDVQSAADFIVMAIEAGRKDKLKEIQFSLDLTPPALWILP